MIVFLVRVCCELYYVFICIMSIKGESRQSPQQPLLPLHIEFSILGPTWFDDSYFDGIQVKDIPSPANLSRTLQQEELLDSISLSNDISPENSPVGVWSGMHDRRQKKHPIRICGCKRRDPAQNGSAFPAERRKHHGGTNRAFSAIDLFLSSAIMMIRGTSSATPVRFG